MVDILFNISYIGMYIVLIFLVLSVSQINKRLKKIEVNTDVDETEIYDCFICRTNFVGLKSENEHKQHKLCSDKCFDKYREMGFIS